jgi:alkanesulfonate monooxygenase SsuD/methylene tetrahydromethanopterin reductase-like flavin-dependent oxidoreductase (luciferase family)
MVDMDFGFAALLMEDPASGVAPRWDDVREWANLAEQVGCDVFWVPDELVWEDAEAGTAAGWWECVAMAGAVSASTSSIGVGSWVLSALHRNPGLTAKVVETLDEISGGRFVFGFGSGHSGRQGEAFGFPPDRVVSRYEEALEIIIPLLRDGSADLAGAHHRAVRQQARPRGPRSGSIPIMLGGHGPRTIGLAVRYGDLWSAYATTSCQPEAFKDLLAEVDRACDEQGRDRTSLGRSIGIGIAPPGEAAGGLWAGVDPVAGSHDQIVDTLGRFAEMGVTRLELCLDVDPRDALPALAPIIAEVQAS